MGAQIRLPRGEILTGIKKVGESMQVPDRTRLHFRFLWHGRSGAWSDEGVTAIPPHESRH
jgi:hypothetical protein